MSDADQVALAVHVSEKLRGDAVPMAQVQNNPKDQAMRSNLPGAAVQALFGAMTAHQQSVTHLLSDEESRRLFLDVVYELLTRDRAASLMQQICSCRRIDLRPFRLDLRPRDHRLPARLLALDERSELRAAAADRQRGVG